MDILGLDSWSTLYRRMRELDSFLIDKGWRTAVPTQANTVHVTHYTLHTRLGTTGRGMYPAEHQSRRVEANVGDCRRRQLLLLLQRRRKRLAGHL